MTRDEVAELLLGARTAEEYDRAERALESWMLDHPDDHSMRDAARALGLFRLAPPHEPASSRRPSLEDVAEAERAYYMSPEYAMSFDQDVQAAMARFGWDYAEAY